MILNKALIPKAVRVLARGGLIVYPTDTIYGIGADATNLSAVKKVCAAKRRSVHKPISIMVSDFEMLAQYAKVNDTQWRVLRRKLPGPYTFILKLKRPLGVSKTKVGFRIPKHWCIGLPRQLGRPITTTSANTHFEPAPATVAEIRKIFGKRVALYIDGGRLDGKPSKVIDLTTGKVVR